MTERRFTPGPWRAVDNSWEISSVYADDGETLIAEIPIDSSVGEDTQDEFERIKEANAALIASAPDLVREAKFLLARLGEINLDDDTDDLIRDWNGHVEPSITRLRELVEALS